MTSGRPIFPESLAIIRRSVERAISSPPPTQWPLMAAMTTLGVLANLSRVSWQYRQNIALKSGAAFLSISMSAPALKNPGTELSRTMTRASSSNRSSSIAAWSSFIMSRS